MYEIRRANDRGHANHGWLDSYHSFSFADYWDPQHVEFGPLRVINEDRVVPGAGFGTHGHQDMEIISYVLEGELAHKDSTGTSSVIRQGDVQRMSAGRGVMHSEFNHSQSQPVHFLQIWIQPDVTGIAPEYEQKRFEPDEKRGRLRLVASPDGAEGSVRIHQDARLFTALLDGAERTMLEVAPDRRLYVHVARGKVTANGEALDAGDALKLTATPVLSPGRRGGCGGARFRSACVGIKLAGTPKRRGSANVYTLYYTPGTASMVVHLTLLELGVPYRLEKVDFEKDAQHGAEYLRLNPRGQVPTLVIDGKPHFESAALLMILAERHPEARLAPAPGSPLRADWYQWIAFFTNSLGSRVSPVVLSARSRCRRASAGGAGSAAQQHRGLLGLRRCAPAVERAVHARQGFLRRGPACHHVHALVEEHAASRARVAVAAAARRPGAGTAELAPDV